MILFRFLYLPEITTLNRNVSIHPSRKAIHPLFTYQGLLVRSRCHGQSNSCRPKPGLLMLTHHPSSVIIGKETEKRCRNVNQVNSLQHFQTNLHQKTLPRGYTILCSTQLSMKFFLLINIKMPTIVGILTFMSGKK